MIILIGMIAMDQSPVLGYRQGDVVRVIGTDTFTAQIKGINESGTRYRVIDKEGVSQWVWKSEIARHATSKEATEYFRG